MSLTSYLGSNDTEGENNKMKLTPNKTMFAEGRSKSNSNMI